MRLFFHLKFTIFFLLLVLQAHRPAFADELDKLEGELRRYYEVYIDRFRNLDFLEHDLDLFHESEMEELEEYERKRNRNAERIRREQLKQVICLLSIDPATFRVILFG